jgi:thiol-disulfide isomerase/thioredoxin
MHLNEMCAPSSRSAAQWSRRLMEGVICLASVIAGATLVVIAMPGSQPLSAGANVGSAVPQVGLLDFTASWCGPCQQMSPIVEGLQRQGYPVYKIDVDQRPDLAKQFRITGMPTFLLVVDGKEVMRQTGATSESQLRRMLLQIPEHQKLAQQTRPTTKSPQVVSADPDFGPASSPVNLGSPQPDASRTVAANPAPSKPKFALPFFGRDKEPKPPVAQNAPAEVRAQNPDVAALPATVLDPMQASTQLRVKDKTGVNYGSGTIIHSRIGRTLVLTCGHVFRGMDQSCVVEVDVFGRNRKPQTHVGKVLHYDLTADIGVVAIPTQEVLPTIPLATLDKPLVSGDALLSIGCNGVELPSREQVAVTSLNFYEGPDSIQCSGFPVQGRSGGGLFRGNELVGVCIAADPTARRGVYTSLKPIYELMEQAGCAQALPVSQPAAAPAVVAAPVATPATTTAPAAATELDQAMTVAAREAGVTAAQAAVDLEAAFAQSPDAEVICIVRPRDPKAASRTVIIHQATPKLVGYLLDSLEPTPAAPVHGLAATNALIPTTAQQPAVEFGVTSPARTLPEPTRPLSPRR